jgi:hypothetical protein
MVALILLWSLSLVLSGQADATTGYETSGHGDDDDEECAEQLAIQGGDYHDECEDDEECPEQLAIQGGDHDECEDDEECPEQLAVQGGDHDECEDDEECPEQLAVQGGDHDECEDEECPEQLAIQGGDHDECEDDEECPEVAIQGDRDDDKCTTTTTSSPTTSTSSTTTTTQAIAAGTVPILVVTGAGSECVRDIPYLSYALTFEGGQSTRITFDNPQGPDVVYENMPMSGRVLWPGANDNPPDWPGWIFVDGTWEKGDDGYNWARGTINVTFEVNPTATATVSYPDANAICDDPPQVLGVVITPPPSDVSGVEVLPFTGVDPAPIALAAVAAVALGTIMVLAGRREEAEDS